MKKFLIEVRVEKPIKPGCPGYGFEYEERDAETRDDAEQAACAAWWRDGVVTNVTEI